MLPRPRDWRRHNHLFRPCGRLANYRRLRSLTARRKLAGSLRESLRSVSTAQLDAYRNLRYTFSVHVISRKTLRLFWERHPDSQMPLLRWYKAMVRAEFRTFAELKAAFPAADIVEHWIVFNIGGNKYRLIASIHFNRNRVYVRHILTHREYGRGTWKR